MSLVQPSWRVIWIPSNAGSSRSCTGSQHYRQKTVSSLTCLGPLPAETTYVERQGTVRGLQVELSRLSLDGRRCHSIGKMYSRGCAWSFTHSGPPQLHPFDDHWVAQVVGNRCPVCGKCRVEGGNLGWLPEAHGPVFMSIDSTGP